MKNLILTTLLIIFCLSCKNSSEKDSKTDNLVKASNKCEIKIEGMNCTGCEHTIKNTLNGIKGIKAISASYLEGNAIIEMDPELADTNEIKNKIKEDGYNVVRLVSLSNDSILTK